MVECRNDEKKKKKRYEARDNCARLRKRFSNDGELRRKFGGFKFRLSYFKPILYLYQTAEPGSKSSWDLWNGDAGWYETNLKMDG